MRITVRFECNEFHRNLANLSSDESKVMKIEIKVKYNERELPSEIFRVRQRKEKDQSALVQKQAIFGILLYDIVYIVSLRDAMKTCII